jgi:hypothetical protein
MVAAEPERIRQLMEVRVNGYESDRLTAMRVTHESAMKADFLERGSLVPTPTSNRSQRILLPVSTHQEDCS